MTVSRREMIIGAIGGLAALARRTTGVWAAASQPATPVRFGIPAGACDCHTHIFDPRQFPFVATRVYTPESASVDEMRTLHRALHMDRVVIVQPSVYGTNNACTLDAVRQLGSRARAVAVVDDTVSASELDAMHAAGESADRREPAAHALGQRLAASRFSGHRRPQGDRSRAADGHR